jgi:hypothetical protein
MNISIRKDEKIMAGRGNCCKRGIAKPEDEINLEHKSYHNPQTQTKEKYPPHLYSQR